MLKPIWSQRRCDRLVSGVPGRIDRRSEWSELRFCGRVPMDEAPEDHALEILTSVRTGEPGLVENHGHAWIRLVRPDGCYSSLGFFPDESTEVEPDERPGLRMPGMLLMPDKYDRMDWNLRSVRLPLDQKAFTRVQKHLEDMQEGRLSGHLAFDLVDRSCVGFVVRIAAVAGVRVEAETRLTDFLGSRWRRRNPGIAASAGAPLRWLRFRLFNLCLYPLGGRVALRRQWLRHSDGGRERLHEVDRITPLFGGWRDVLGRPVPFYHVRALRQWQSRVVERGLSAYVIDGQRGLGPCAVPEQAGDAEPPDRTNGDSTDAGGKGDQVVVP